MATEVKEDACQLYPCTTAIFTVQRNGFLLQFDRTVMLAGLMPTVRGLDQDLPALVGVEVEFRLQLLRA